MRKAIVERGTNAVRNIIVVDPPRAWQAEIVKRVIRAARKEQQWVNEKTGERIIKPAMPEESRLVLHLLDHGFRPLAGPLHVSGSPDLTDGKWYWVKPIGPDDFLLLDDPSGPPVALTKPGTVTLTDAPFDPGADVDLVDDDGSAEIGGKWNRAARRFEKKPAV